MQSVPKSNVSNIKWLFKASRGIRARVLFRIFVGVLQTSASLSFIWLTKKIIDVATHRNGAKEEVSELICYLLICIVCQLLLYVIQTFGDRYNNVFLLSRLKYNIFRDVLVSDWNGVSLYHTGDIINRLDDDLCTICNAITNTVPSIIVVFIQMIASFIFVYSFNIQLAWLLILLMPILMLVNKYYIPKMRALTHTVKSIESRSTAFVQEKIQRRVMINSICRSDDILKQFRSIMDQFFQNSMKRTRYSIMSRTMLQIGFYSGYLIAFVWGVNGLMEQAITFGTLSALLQLVYQIQHPAVEIASKVSNFSKVLVAIDRLSELSSLNNHNDRPSGPAKTLGGRIGVRLDSVTYAYPDINNKYILNSLSYDFTPSSFHLIMGKTGSGKSTLIRLILGILKPSNGAVGIYNEDDFYNSSVEVRSNFVYVPQGNTLSSGTIRSNLLLGNPGATDSQIRSALYVANAEFVFDLPQKLDTHIGELGEGVSEGEAQRIIIARALLQSGNVLLLDEPTSALDSDAERILIERLNNHNSMKTIIMVTHKNIDPRYIKSILKL